MKVYRIKHKPSGRFVSSTYSMNLYNTTRNGKIFKHRVPNLKQYEDNPDYEVIWFELND